MVNPAPVAPPDQTELGAKTFGMNDQALFAAWSGDHNPMHVDELAARRLVSGRPVVHGMHTVLEALARWAPRAVWPPRRMRVEFVRPINVGESVCFVAHVRSDGLSIEAQVDGQVRTRIDLSVDGDPSAAPLPPPELHLPALPEPLDRDPSSWASQVHALPATGSAIPSVHAVAAWLGPAATAGLGQLSTLVGMACPGQHSIFSSLSVDLRAVSEPLRFRLRRHEPRFRLVELDVDGPWQGRVKAFVRQPPQVQPAMATLTEDWDRSRLAGSCSWVLGGSRGLGELTAKLLAAGGGDVVLTYAVGEADARRVADEINAAGRGRADVAPYVAGLGAAADLCRRLPRPDAVFYFATPRIARERTGVVDSALLGEFIRYYVDEPAHLAAALQAQFGAPAGPPDRPIGLFNPSTVYVEEVPAGLVEYAMAKAASEVMAKDLARRLPGVRMVCTRLPRLPTDQTSGLMQSKAANPVPVMCQVITEMLPQAAAPPAAGVAAASGPPCAADPGASR